MRLRRRPRRRTLSCRQVARDLQEFLDRDLRAGLDGRVDDDLARRMQQHLEACRDCGLEASTYLQIKRTLAGRRPLVDDDALTRLRAFGHQLADHLD